jgi:hypothetical protein
MGETMNTEKVPVEIFVQQVLGTKAAQRIIDQWPVKGEDVIQIVTKHLNSIGIFMVSPAGQDKIVQKSILFFLNNSSLILEMIDKAKRAAALAAQRGKSTQDV